MGNYLTVANPYIIDEILTDEEEEEDDDYFNYETAYDTEPGEHNDLDNDDVPDTSQNHDRSSETLPNGHNVEVNTQVVSSLVKEVETLLNFLDKEDFESARKSAHSLTNDVSIEAQDGSYDEDEATNTEPFLHTPTDGQKPQDEDSIESLSKELWTGSECVETLVQKKEDNSLLSSQEDTPKGAWTPAEHKVLRKLDRDLTSFEENESRLITDLETSSTDGHQHEPRRRARKSSLPRLKRSSLSKSPSSSDAGYIGCDTCSNTGVPHRSRESSLTRSSPRRSPISGIPRFCYKPPVASSSNTTATSPMKPVPSSRSSSGSALKGAPNNMTRSVEEAVTNCVRSYTSQAARSSSEADHRGQRPSSNHVGETQGQSNHAESWEINISDSTGRAKRNKKRSGIPSLWTQRTSPNNKTPTNPSRSQPASPAPSLFDTTSLSLTDSLTRLSSLDDDRLPKTSAPTTPDPVQDRWNMGYKKVLDQRRWNCISRPQYKRSCGISSLISCWNFLFSTMGYGHLHPLTHEEAMSILGFEAPFDDIVFGPFTGNLTLFRWFHLLNEHFKVHGRAYFLYKPKGKKQTIGVTSEMALQKFKSGLSDRNTTFIYHCHNHYFTPIGYEDSPQYPSEAYSNKLTPETTEKTWIFVGDTSRRYVPIHCKSWEEICLDLNCESPDYFNIRESWKGVKQRGVKKTGNNLHCIMCYQAVNTSSFISGKNLSPDGNVPGFILHPPYDEDSSTDNRSMMHGVEVGWQSDSLFLDYSTEEEVESASNTDITPSRSLQVQISTTSFSMDSGTSDGQTKHPISKARLSGK